MWEEVRYRAGKLGWSVSVYDGEAKFRMMPPIPENKLISWMLVACMSEDNFQIALAIIEQGEGASADAEIKISEIESRAKRLRWFVDVFNAGSFGMMPIVLDEPAPWTFTCDCSQDSWHKAIMIIFQEECKHTAEAYGHI